MGTIKDLTDTYFMIKEKSKELLKKHDYDKYVELVEEEYLSLYKKTIELQNKVNEYEESRKLEINTNHIQILKLFTKDIDYTATDYDLNGILKENIELEISFNELRENEYIYYVGSRWNAIEGDYREYSLKENKISEVLKAIRNDKKRWEI